MTVVSAPGAPPHDDSFSAQLRGFGIPGMVATIAIVLSGNVFIPGTMFVLPISAALVLVWVRLSKTPWAEIGYALPASWLRSLALGIVLGIALKLLMKAIVMPLFGADPVNQAFRHLTGNRALLPAAVWMMFAAGFGEETVFRGFLFERLRKLFGSGAAATISIVGLTSAWFGLAHYAVQGIAGVQQATIVGVIYAAIYARTRTLWMVMWAHTAFDLTALAIIYWNLESDVAHLVFD